MAYAIGGRRLYTMWPWLEADALSAAIMRAMGPIRAADCGVEKCCDVDIDERYHTVVMRRRVGVYMGIS